MALQTAGDVQLGPHTWYLTGAGGGQYPDGNSLLLVGEDTTALVDPSLTVGTRPELADPGATDPVGLVLMSHVHEDHLAGLRLFPDRPVRAHAEDLAGLASFEGLLGMYGYPPGALPEFETSLIEEFHYQPRPDATAFHDGEVIDLGGVTVTVVHLPGHTRGHSGLLVEPDGVAFLADIDLSGFGPYYGDAWSDLEAFERSLRRCREIEARWYATFHHKGAIEGREAFLPMLDAYASVIGRREEAILAFLADRPRTLDELVEHRFVYRPHVELPFVAAVERRSAELHLRRLVARGEVGEHEGRFERA